jgi:hypothetical protein
MIILMKNDHSGKRQISEHFDLESREKAFVASFRDRSIGSIASPFHRPDTTNSIDPDVRSWQERLEPFGRWAFEGCHLTRDIPALLAEGGFEIEKVETAHLVPQQERWRHFPER